MSAPSLHRESTDSLIHSTTILCDSVCTMCNMCARDCMYVTMYIVYCVSWEL